MLLLLLISPFLAAISSCLLFLTDLCWWIFGKRSIPADVTPRNASGSLVIPNWNGRDLLEKYLPSVIAAMAGHPDSEIIVVENGSTDGSADFVRANFPQVRLVALPRNLGFGGGSNAGFAAAKNDIVVLLNSDMRVEADFLAPLLAGFTDDRVFAVSCQIFLSDPSKRREETGLTQGWWQDGTLRVSHREDETIRGLFPCFYGGGGSCAFDRKKFLDLGGFDELLSPFYLEDTDLGYQAWKRGWKVLYQPASVVWHEHRGTIGKTFSPAYIQSVLKKNFLLFAWKNIHEPRRLFAHLFFSYAGAIVSLLFGDEPGRANLKAWWLAFKQLPAAVRSRWHARTLAAVSDTEAFLRPQAGYYYDRFLAAVAVPERLKVLFVSPYSIFPPIHGGGVFMYETLRELSRLCEVHAIVMLDYGHELAANREALGALCASAEFIVRGASHEPHLASIVPHAVQEFKIADVKWLIHRAVFDKKIDVVQLEYTPLGQYVESYCRVASVLFEHDIYFQSIARGLGFIRSTTGKLKARFEYLRATRFELKMLPQCDHVQVCTRENREYLLSFLPALKSKVQDGLRAGISTASYLYPGGPRDARTMLFLGSFRHEPNRIALDWFSREVLPHVVQRYSDARLLVVGSDPPRHAYTDPAGAIDMLGFVEDIRPLLARCTVFVCPIRSGSGVRVKLLEAFASGIPVVSTHIGAEGLARESGEFCFLADDPKIFAEHVLQVFEDPHRAAEVAARARAEVAAHWDMNVITQRLVESYKEVLRQKRDS